jgi:hypothetical protein
MFFNKKYRASIIRQLEIILTNLQKFCEGNNLDYRNNFMMLISVLLGRLLPESWPTAVHIAQLLQNLKNKNVSKVTVTPLQSYITSYFLE